MAEESIPIRELNEMSEPVNDKEKTLVLLAEDDESNVLFFKALARSMKFDYIHAANGEEAVKICSENSDIGIVFMDLKMPVMNGYDATRAIKKFRPELPVVALTAFAFETDKQKAFEAGCDDHISKPMDWGIFKSVFNKYMES